jgi:hypothetical protein
MTTLPTARAAGWKFSGGWEYKGRTEVMRRLITCLDIMTACTLTVTGWYMYVAFSDLLSRALLIGAVGGIGLMTAVHVASSIIRSKRRIGNMIEAEPGEFTA